FCSSDSQTCSQQGNNFQCVSTSPGDGGTCEAPCQFVQGAGPATGASYGVIHYCESYQCSTGDSDTCAQRCDVNSSNQANNPWAFSGTGTPWGHNSNALAMDPECYDRQIDWYGANGSDFKGYRLQPKTKSGAECDDIPITPPPLPEFCYVESLATCVDNKIQVNWEAETFEFDLSPTEGRVVIRIDNLKDGWGDEGGSDDKWWSTHTTAFLNSGMSPYDAAWSFDFEPNAQYSIRAAVNPVPGEYKAEGLCSEIAYVVSYEENCGITTTPTPTPTPTPTGTPTPVDNPASISGYKYEDVNGDGIKNFNDSNMSDWTIELYGPSFSEPRMSFMQTNGLGNYSFTGLSAGTYHVCEINQLGWTQTQPSAGPQSPVDGTHCYQITLTEGQNVTRVFGNMDTDGIYEPGTITGIKYYDENGDGEKDSGEPNLPNWRIQLYDSSFNIAISEVITNGVGEFTFSSINPGLYYVCEVLQNNWSQTEPSTSNYTSPVDGSNCFAVNLGSGGYVDYLEFGNEFELGIAANTEISGTKYEDEDRDGNRDSGEQRLSGWYIIVLEQGTGDFVSSTWTDGNGNYSIEGLPVGNYYVCEENRSGWSQTEPNYGYRYNNQYCYPVSIFSDTTTHNGLDFGNVQGDLSGGNSVSGWKFLDANRNGVQDSGDSRYPNWGITLYNDGFDVIDFQYTNPNGDYYFSNLPEGTYYICEDNRPNWEQTRPTSGTVRNGQYCYRVDLDGNENITGLQFGNYFDSGSVNGPEGLVEGYKWSDANQSGTWDAGETTLANWGIRIRAIDGRVYDQIVQTNSAGFYRLMVPTGVYRVEEIQQSGWSQTAPSNPNYCDITVTDNGVFRCDFGNYLNAVVPPTPINPNDPPELVRTGIGMQAPLAFGSVSSIVLGVIQVLRKKYLLV
ncbi:hypothetical protein KC717_05690, partial [Candidatus Dojkabacteria bacterium]|nr:hypothetical protein [Candidatus Dojkabacteria bacterium]